MHHVFEGELGPSPSIGGREAIENTGAILDVSEQDRSASDTFLGRELMGGTSRRQREFERFRTDQSPDAVEVARRWSATPYRRLCPGSTTIVFAVPWWSIVPR
jgi:hypothetical protein